MLYYILLTALRYRTIPSETDALLSNIDALSEKEL